MQARLTSKVAALAALGMVALAGCSSSGGKGGGVLQAGGIGGSASTAGSTSGTAPTYTIGTEMALSGANAQLGINEINAIEVAIAQANSNSALGFKIKLVKSDDEGDPTKSPAAANQLVQNDAVLGVVGPTFSGVTTAVGSIYEAATLPFITPSASAATLGTHSWKYYHRIVPNDNVEGTQGADWMARHGVRNLFVLQDLSTYGKGVGDTVAQEARAKGIKVTEQGLDGTSTTNYNPIAQTIARAGADAVFFGGYDSEGALLAQALQSAGFKGLAVAGNGLKSTTFTKNGGAATNGWYLTCGCQDATVAPAAKAFTTAYQAMWHTQPSTYSPEAYDATNLLIQAIKNAGTNPSRQAVEAALGAIDYQGITTEIKFQSDGENASDKQVVNLFQVKNDEIVQLGNIKDQN